MKIKITRKKKAKKEKNVKIRMERETFHKRKLPNTTRMYIIAIGLF